MQNPTDKADGTPVVPTMGSVSTSTIGNVNVNVTEVRKYTKHSPATGQENQDHETVKASRNKANDAATTLQDNATTPLAKKDGAGKRTRNYALPPRRNDATDRSAHPTLQKSVLATRLPRNDSAGRRNSGRFPLPPSCTGSAVTKSTPGTPIVTATVPELMPTIGQKVKTLITTSTSEATTVEKAGATQTTTATEDGTALAPTTTVKNADDRAVAAGNKANATSASAKTTDGKATDAHKVTNNADAKTALASQTSAKTPDKRIAVAMENAASSPTSPSISLRNSLPTSGTTTPPTSSLSTRATSRRLSPRTCGPTSQLSSPSTSLQNSPPTVGTTSELSSPPTGLPTPPQTSRPTNPPTILPSSPPTSPLTIPTTSSPTTRPISQPSTSPPTSPTTNGTISQLSSPPTNPLTSTPAPPPTSGTTNPPTSLPSSPPISPPTSPQTSIPISHSTSPVSSPSTTAFSENYVDQMLESSQLQLTGTQPTLCPPASLPPQENQLRTSTSSSTYTSSSSSAVEFSGLESDHDESLNDEADSGKNGEYEETAASSGESSAYSSYLSSAAEWSADGSSDDDEMVSDEADSGTNEEYEDTAAASENVVIVPSWAKPFPIGCMIERLFKRFGHLYRGKVTAHWWSDDFRNFYIRIDYEDGDKEDVNKKEMVNKKKKVTRLGEGIRNDGSVTLVVEQGPHKGATFHLGKGGSAGVLFGRKPTWDPKWGPATCELELANMRYDKDMKPNHVFITYGPLGQGGFKLKVVDKSNGFTLIDNVVVDSAWGRLGQCVKMGKTVLKIEARRCNFED